MIGVPFVDKGRSLRGLDCWGVVWLGHRDAASHALPLHGGVGSEEAVSAADEIVRACSSEMWREVAGDEQELDVVVMTAPSKTPDGWVNLPRHVGLVVAPGEMIHCEEKTGTVHVAFRAHPSVARRVVGVYRHRDFL